MASDQILPAPRPNCPTCRGTGTKFYQSGPDDISHDICDCIVEQGYYQKAAALGTAIAFQIMSGGDPCAR